MSERGLPSIKRMFQYRTDLASDYKEVDYLQAVDTHSQYIRIHGVLFRSSEIVRLFHGTPIASAASQASEYDPSWLSHRDVKLIADMISGRVMPYTYYTELSNEAHVHLSNKDTFFYLYSFDYMLDLGFMLGERMTDYLVRFKQSKHYDTLSNKTKTLLSLF